MFCDNYLNRHQEKSVAFINQFQVEKSQTKEQNKGLSEMENRIIEKPP